MANNLENSIIVRGAREHNLKNINIDIPKKSLVVITGLSGSGKSSLAFDTIFAEGQRRYVESLSSYARQFLEKLNKPDLDSIEGLSPSISIEQRTTSHNPRSTVGTMTEIYDYMRLLWAKIAKPIGVDSTSNDSQQTPTDIVDKIYENPQGSRIQILAPLVIERKGEHKKEIELARKNGFSKIRINNKVVDLVEEIHLEKHKKHSLTVIIDRVILRNNDRARIQRSVEHSLKLTNGVVTVEVITESDVKSFSFSTGYFDSATGLSIPKPEPRLFSFNSPVGACPKCKGLGYSYNFDPNLIVSNPSISIAEGALESWTQKQNPQKPSHEFQMIEALSKHYKFSLNEPFTNLPEKIKDLLFYGTGKEEIVFQFKGKSSSFKSKRSFEGIIGDLEKKKKLMGADAEEEFEDFISKFPCESCNGNRLKNESLVFKIAGKSIAEASRLPLSESYDFFKNLKLDKKEKELGELILIEILSRISFLIDVGLDYLDISRGANTLSGGETQRVRLATQIGASLVGVLYVLDEPSIGLHQKDNVKLIESLKGLRDKGNSVIVVEHDRDTIEQADYVVDMGPGAGKLGGEVIAQGTPKSIIAIKDSPTGRFLRGLDQVPLPEKKRPYKDKPKLEISGCQGNNLKNVSASFPIGCLIGVSGVSGSGKSTLIFDTLVPAMRQSLNRFTGAVAPFSKLKGIENFDKIVNVDQSPIGRSPRSNPSTYSGVFTQIRQVFAQTMDAQIRGYGIGRFSFNVKGGRCEVCQGDGAIRVQMHFLPDVFVPCTACNGLRYNRETLSVRYKGKNIADVLAMSVSEALEFFKAIPSVEKFLRVLDDVGLGYVNLGQSATTLSGGEAQRMKLSRELSKRPTGKTLYILDEPSTGLHFQDIIQLLSVLHKLVNQGNTIIIIEHNLDILKHTDYLIDLGPDGGIRGGEVIAQGSPEEIVKKGKGHTAEFLKPYFK
ncbi:MAG: excinuclease ABC subunit UvrA [Oligoflexia bacterium]|nr:excinuclease ABC subunit UvrA [Oligoflexia bacterium]